VLERSAPRGLGQPDPRGDHQAGLHGVRRGPGPCRPGPPPSSATRSRASADHVLFAWVTGGVTGGDLHALVTTGAALAGGTALPADTVLVPQTATDRVSHARVAAALGGGFALAVRRISKTSSMAPGKIELYQVSAAGALVGTPVLVTDQSGSDFYDDEGFGFASQPDGTVMLAWHLCNSSGDLCTLSGRILTLVTVPGTGPRGDSHHRPFRDPDHHRQQPETALGGRPARRVRRGVVLITAASRPMARSRRCALASSTRPCPAAEPRGAPPRSARPLVVQWRTSVAGSTSTRAPGEVGLRRAVASTAGTCVAQGVEYCQRWCCETGRPRIPARRGPPSP